MNLKNRFYPESNFGGFSDIDSTIKFYTRVNGLLQPSFTVLDFGCGRGAYSEDSVEYRRNLQIMKGKVSKVIGIDVDQTAASNPFIDEFYLLDNDDFPLGDNSIDLCVCNWVLEHLEHPQIFFKEMQRVIKNDGYLCMRTSNKWSYVSIFARTIPNTSHSKVLSFIQPGRKVEDEFDTFFLCNTIPSIKKGVSKIGENYVVYGHEGEPSYLGFSRITYGLGRCLHKIIPNYFRSSILAFVKIKK